MIPAPTITGFTPTSGRVGTSVTITGTNFTGATQVQFNTTNATSYTVDSATQITATVACRHHHRHDQGDNAGWHRHQHRQLHRDPGPDHHRLHARPAAASAPR